MKKETVSDNGRRGRPQAFGPDMDAAIAIAWEGATMTKRTTRNKQYIIMAQRAISLDGQGDGEFHEHHGWFVGGGRNYRQTVLAELGRIAVRYGDVTARAIADELADKVLSGEITTTRQAASWLRRCRLSASGKINMARAGGLQQALVAAIDSYLDQHPDATAALVRDAVCGALDYAASLSNHPKAWTLIERARKQSEIRCLCKTAAGDLAGPPW
jgi:hypothetical protein